MADQGMLPNIRKHSLQVARVAQVGGPFAARHPLDLALLDAGALLHDIAKTECLKTKVKAYRHRGRVSGGPGVSGSGRNSGPACHLESGACGPRVTEIEIVHYADKRVLHEEIVDLQTRFDYLQNQYGRTPEDRKRIAALLENSLNQEKKIFRYLPFNPQN